jgi:hypothetical protein
LLDPALDSPLQLLRFVLVTEKAGAESAGKESEQKGFRRSAYLSGK